MEVKKRNHRRTGNPKGRPKNQMTLWEFENKYMKKKMPYNWHHKLFCDILSNEVIQQKDGKLYQNKLKKVNKTILALAPRFHAKSQIFTIDYPVYRIVHDPNIRIIIISANEDIAVSFNRAISNQLEMNEKLIEDFGYLVPEKAKRWGEKAIIVKRTSLEKDPTVAAIGVGGKMISKRADIIICDDIIDLELARTKSGRAKTREWLENVVLPILEDDGQLIVCGTVWYKQDIYDYLWQESNFDIKIKLKALIYCGSYIRKDGKGVRFLPYHLNEFPLALKAETLFSPEIMRRYELGLNLRGGVLWEAKWDLEKLMAKKANMSPNAFMRQYLNEPGSEQERRFREEYIKRSYENGASKTLVTSWSNSASDKYFGTYGHLIIAVGVDLAISRKSTADNSAISVWGLSEKRQRILLYVDFGKWSMDELKQRIRDVYHNFNPVKIRVENVGFQDMLRQEMAEELPIEGFHTTGQKKFSEEVGVAHMALLAEQGKMTLPGSRADPFTLARVGQLVSEMETFTEEVHTGDVLMSSWFATNVLLDFDNKMKDNRGFFPTTTIVEQARNVKAPNKVVLLNESPRFFKFSFSSAVSIYRDCKEGEDWIEDKEQFLFFVTRRERACCFILNREDGKIVGKIEGDLTALSFCNLLVRAGKYFNNAKIVIDRTGEGESILLEMQNRFYSDLMCTQPDERGGIKVEEGFKISAGNLPLAIDYTRGKINNMEIDIYDDQVVKEMGEIMGVDGDKLETSYGTGQRFMTLALAVWILDNYEKTTKKLYNSKGRQRKMNLPYLVFQK